jgi:hypothetical protein
MRLSVSGYVPPTKPHKPALWISAFEAVNFRIWQEFFGLATGTAGTTGAWPEPIPVALSLLPTGFASGYRNPELPRA